MGSRAQCPGEAHTDTVSQRALPAYPEPHYWDKLMLVGFKQWAG